MNTDMLAMMGPLGFWEMLFLAAICGVPVIAGVIAIVAVIIVMKKKGNDE